MTDRITLQGVSKMEAPPAENQEFLVSVSVVKAAQAVSGEIILDRLIPTVMTIALEHADAERGVLILLRDDTPWIEAEVRTAHKTVDVRLRQETVAPAEMPNSLLRTVLQTRQSLILDDASAPNPFSADAYLQQQRVRSVLCLPLLRQAKLIGLLYLENNLVPRVAHNAGYSLFSLTRACAVVNCQFAFAWFRLRLSCQAATSSIRACLSGIRRSRHCDDRTLSSDSAMFSQLPCFGV